MSHPAFSHQQKEGSADSLAGNEGESCWKSWLSFFTSAPVWPPNIPGPLVRVEGGQEQAREPMTDDGWVNESTPYLHRLPLNNIADGALSGTHPRAG